MVTPNAGKPADVGARSHRDVALFGSDTAHGVPNTVSLLNLTVIHPITFVARGMKLFDTFELEAVADTAARLGHWTCLCPATPVRVPRGTGSSINPIGVF